MWHQGKEIIELTQAKVEANAVRQRVNDSVRQRASQGAEQKTT